MFLKNVKWSLLFKGFIAFALCYSIYTQIVLKNDLEQLLVSFRQQLNTAPIWQLILLLVLVPFNLMLEACKFRLLQPNESRPSLRLAFMQVCAGLSVGLFTPNRIGEYVGRLSGTAAKDRGASIVATLLGGFAQLLPLISFGVLAAFLFENQAIQEYLSDTSLWLASSLAAVILLILVYLKGLVNQINRALNYLLLEYFSTGGFINKTIKRVQNLLDSLLLLLLERPQDMYLAILISYARYGIYLLQLSLAFLFFGLGADMKSALLGSALLLFIQTFIPLPSVIQALARVEIAMLLWQSYAPNQISIVAASLLIFVINLALPALLGLTAILQTDINKTFKVDT